MNIAVKLQTFRMRFLRCGNMSVSTNTHRRRKLPMSPITDSLPLSEIRCWRRPTAKRTALCSAHGSRIQTAIQCSGEITRRTMNMLDEAEIDKAVLRSKMTECLARKYKELGNGCCAVQMSNASQITCTLYLP